MSVGTSFSGLILDFLNVTLLVVKSTESKTHRGHITATECRPDFTAAFGGDDGTTLWPCIRLDGEDASAGIPGEAGHLVLALPPPDLHVAQ
jgi:hypothetical protein